MDLGIRFPLRAEYRRAFRGQGVDLIQDVERVVVYTVGLSFIGWLELSQRRAILFVCLAAAGALFAVSRIANKAHHLRYTAGMLDVFLVSTGLAAATGSWVIILLTTAVMCVAVLVTYQDRNGTTLVVAGLSLLAAFGLAAQLESIEPMNGAAVDPAVQVILAILVSGMVVLGVTVLLLWRFRLRLMEREVDLAAVLDAAPVVVGRVDRTGVLRELSGDEEGWFGAIKDGVEDVPAVILPEIASVPTDAIGTEVEIGDHILSVTTIPQASGDVVFTAYDITAVAVANRRLEQLVRSKDELIASISHELRTPLTSVLGFALELRDRCDGKQDEHELMSLLASESEEMAAIIEDLLVAARADLGTLAISVEPVDLADVASWASDSVAGVQATLDPEAVVVDADPTRLRQIVRNLLTNASRYGGPDLRVSCGPCGDVGYLEVADRGHEIAAEQATQMFEPYVSAGPNGSQPAAIGLGLPVSRGLATLMDGSLTYRHETGWNVFRLELPVSKSPAALSS